MQNASVGIRIALLVIMVTFLYLFAVTFMDVPETGNEHAKTIVPFLLGSVIGTLMGFYWGNSSSGTKKPVIEGENNVPKE